MKATNYPGFGVEKSVTGWARFLGLPYATVWRYLNDGATPEEIAAEKGLTLDMGQLGELPARDKRRKAEVEKIMADILDASGYDPDGLEVRVESEKGQLVIVWNDSAIGVYDYLKDALHLTGGDGLKIRYPIVPDPMIDKDDEGKWKLHSRTKLAILAKNT